MVSAVYPAVLERGAKGFGVFFPDFPGCVSAGQTEQEAFVNAEEALTAHVQLLGQFDEAIPEPSAIDSIDRDPEVEEVARFLVRVDLPGKSVRLNITMDEGLVASIDRIARNRSAFLADAARHELARRRELAKG